MAPDPDDRDFSSLFEFLPVGAYRSLPDGRQLRANPALVAMNGYASEAELLASVRDIGAEWYVEPGRRAEFRARLEADGTVIGFESEVWRHKTRERIWVREHAHLVRDAEGRVRFYEGTVEEITDRVLERRANAEQRRRTEQLLAAVPGMVYRLRVGPSGERCFTYVSEGVRALYGVSPEAVMADADVLSRHRHPDDTARILAETGTTVRRMGPFHIEFRIVLDEGRQKWLQIASTHTPPDADGVAERVGVVLDITERKLVEDALRETGALWKRALESSADGVWDWNLETGEETFSPKLLALYGWREGELAARVEAWDTLTHPDDVPAMQQARGEHFAGRTAAYVNEHRMRCRNGQWKWILSRGIVIARDDAGRPLRMVGTHTDMTADKEAQALRSARDRAEAADLAKSQFLSRVSHELRTPLNAILGFAQLLELDPGDSPRQRGWVQQVLASGRHLLALMDDILDLSSAQTGQLPVRAEAVPLAPVIDEALAMVAGSAAEAGVVLVNAAPRDRAGLVLRGDRKRVKQVVSNLLTNAVKYTGRGGRVELTARACGDQVELDVSDNGPGLDAEQQARLFRPFERVGAQRGPVAGTGLGLALSRQLAQAMGGSLTVASSPGQGATFTLTLPAAS